MTTKWGKVLVFVNLVIALGMAVWAFGLYSGRIDWSDKAPKGELAKRRATANELWKSLASAESRQRASLATLRGLEALRPLQLAVFQKEVSELESGNAPARKIAVQNGQMLFNADGTPQMVPALNKLGQPLQSVAVYENELKNTQTAMLAAVKLYQQLVEDDNKLTERIVGDKGLRQQIFDEEQIKQARVKQEIEDLKPVYLNVLVDSELLLKRQRALKARAQELEMEGTKTTQR